MMQEGQLYASWIPTRACNFSCKYCYSLGKYTNPRQISVQRLCSALREHGENWLVHISGGEPFLYPGFIEICKELTNLFQIKINTNLSLNIQIREFSKIIKPDRVELINASLHIEERERLNNVKDFIENVVLLKNRGFKIKVKFVLYPTLMERFQKDCQYFSSRGIELFPKPFKGRYLGKLYPKAYPKEVKHFFSDSMFSSSFYPFCFKGINCVAGKSFIRIDSNGIVSRCTNDSSVLGDIDNGFKLEKVAYPCKSFRCSCFGYDLIERKPFERYNSNYNLFYQVLSNLKYMSMKRFLLRNFNFMLKKFRPFLK